MPKRPIHRMPRERRAKQFAPFRALSGLEAALELMEDTPVPRPILGEESAEELNRDLQILQSKLNVTKEVLIHLKWYEHGQIHSGQDHLRRIDSNRRYLYLSERSPIDLNDLLEIHLHLNS